MEHLWQTVTPIERQAAAAEMWMEMTGRTKTAQAKCFEEATEVFEKAASVRRVPKTAGILDTLAAFCKKCASSKPCAEHALQKVADQEEAPRLRNPAIAGGVAGAALGGAGGVAAMRNHLARSPSRVGTALARPIEGAAKKGLLSRVSHAGIGGALAGAGVGAAAGLGYGVHRLNKHYQKKNEAALGRQRTEMGLQKKAFAPDPLTMALGPLGAGATMGLGAGKALSGPTANMATPRGNKVKAEAIAKKLAIPTAVVGALAGMYLMHGANSNKLRQMAALKFPKLSRGHLDVIEHALIPMFSGMGGGAVAGIATGLAVAGGFRAKSALFGKTASTKERLIGAGAGALTLGGAGALKGYMDHRPGPSGKSRAQFEAQGELDRMKAVFEHQGKDTENLPKMDKARHRYAELKVKAMADGQQSPGRSAAISGLAGGLVGGVTGGLAGPHVGALARRIR